ncbi:MAG: TonB-dependent receptor [Acidobacteria bacterium]|nr:TonB-dependent receptor [Acidobacteriota bacterium]
MQKMTIVCVVVLLSVAVASRAQVTTGTVSGTVTDSTGAVLPNTTVVMLNEDTGVSRTVTTDAAGRYNAASLSLGNYKLTTTLEGFQTEVRTGIVLTLGRQAVVDFQLQVGAVTQTVEVTGEAPLVDTTQSAVSTLVAQTTINELPLNGRSLSDLVLLQPGVVKLEQAAVATHRGYGTQINISGARSDDNIFLLDGTDLADYQNNAPTGPNNVMYGAGSTREFQVQTSIFSAQYGRSMGGVFNAVSKSGTNTLNGEIFEFLRNSALDARDFFDAADLPPFRRNQFGGGVGGPIARDKMFFHGSYEGLRSTRSTTARPTVPGANLRQGILPDGRQVQVSPIASQILQYWPLPSANGRVFPTDGTQEFITETPLITRSDFSQGRVDYQLSDNDSLFGRFTYMSVEQDAISSTPGYSIDTKNDSRFATISHTRILSAQNLNTFRVAFNRNALTENKVTPSLPALKFFPDSPWPGNFSVTGIGMNFGIGILGANFYAITNRYEVMDDFVMNRGNHSVQFGGNFQRVQANQAFPNVPNGSYSFRSVEGFLRNVQTGSLGLGAFRGTPPSVTDWIRGFRISYLGAYIQDDWRVLPNLTLNLGLRYDFQSVPTEVNGKISNFRPLVPGGDFAATSEFVVGDPLWQNPTTKNFAPRLGFAWSPWQDRSTTVRGGVGLFFGRLDARHNWGNRDGYISKGFAVSTPSHFPDGLAEIASAGGTVQVFNTLFDIKTPHTWQWALNVQQQFGDSTVLAVGYVGSRGINLASIANYNAPETTFVDGVLTAPANGTRRNPAVEIMDATGTQGDSWYNGMTLELRRRMTAGLQFQFAYTFSKSISTAEQTSRAQLTSNRTSGYFLDPAHIAANRGLSSWDSRNVIKFNYVYELPFGPRKAWLNSGGLSNYIFGGWQIGGIITLKDGSPYTFTSAVPTVLAGMSFADVRPTAKPGVPVSGVILGKPNETCGGVECQRYIDPEASFSFPGTRQLGNIGRNTGITPGVATWDASIQKSFPLGERMNLQFRAEGFNLTNHTNFGIPNRSMFASNGRPTGTSGTIRSTGADARQFQMGMKLTF